MLIDDDLEEIFTGAVALIGEQRVRFLDKFCGNKSTELRREVESLLAFAGQSECFLEEFAQRISNLSNLSEQAQSIPIDKIGPWSLLKLLGRGGMGNVYLARRADHQHTTSVALKTLPLTSNDPVSRYRFMSERQILARLSHENIARFIDGGVTEQGVPWFVMDYVKGMPIDKYCNLHNHSIKQRLQLFLSAGRAVQYAHNNLVVHRDLKPSNVLVDENGKVKLLDFGIAKIIDNESPKVELTQLVHRPLTPAYASPEMLRGEAVTVTTDVYSLGVMLYEMLTGQRPFNTTCSAAYLNKQSNNQLNKQSNNRPNIKNRQLHQFFRLKNPSSTIENKRLSKELSGDLDTILLTAISPEAEQRYASAKYFTDDIERYLEGFPIQARKVSTVYYIAKVIQRHRVTTFFTTFAVLSLSILTVFSVMQMNNAKQQLELALYQQRHVQATNDFLQLLMAEIGPSGKALTLEQLVDRGVSMLDSQFKSKPAYLGHMLLELSRVYESLNKSTKKERLLKQAESVARDEKDKDLLSVILCTNAEQAFKQKPEDAEKIFVEAISLLAQLPKPSIESLSYCDRARARYLESRGDLPGALTVLKDALARVNKVSPSAVNLQLTLLNRAELIQYSLGLKSDVLQTNKILLSLLEKSGRGFTIIYLKEKMNRAILLDMMGEIRNSMTLRREIMGRVTTADGVQQSSPEFSTRYADGLIRLSLFDEALGIYQGTLHMLEELGDELLSAHHSLSIGKILTHNGNYQEAAVQLTAARTQYSKSPVINKRQLDRVRLAQIKLNRAQGELNKAKDQIEELLRDLEYPAIKTGFELSQALHEAAQIALDIEDLELAEKFASAFLYSAQSLARTSDSSADVGYAFALRGKIRLRANDQNLAKSDLQAALVSLQNGLGAKHLDTLDIAQQLNLLQNSNSYEHSITLLDLR